MPLQDNDTYLIDQYLTGRLTSQEKELFQQRNKDQDFKNALESHQEIAAAIQRKARKDLKAQLKNFEKKNQENTKDTAKVVALETKRSSRSFRMWWAAASIILLVIAFYWLIPRGQPDYFADFFTPYPNVIAPIQKSDDPATIDQQAFYAYELKDYDKAKQLFQQMQSTDITRFYEAMIALETNEIDQAVQYLEDIQGQPDARFSQTATWYLALAYLKIGEKEKAILLLDELSRNSRHPFREKAISLRSKL